MRRILWLSFKSLALSTVFLPTVSIHSVSACGGELGRHQLTLWLELIGSLIFHVSPHTAKIYRRFDWFLPISVHGRFLLTLPGMKVAIISSFLENVYYFLRFTLCRLLCVLCSMMNFKTMFLKEGKCKTNIKLRVQTVRLILGRHLLKILWFGKGGSNSELEKSTQKA